MKILLINPLSSARYLSNALKQLDIQATAIYTRGRDGYDDYTRPDPSFFYEQHYCDADVESVLSQVKGKNFEFVLNGSESTVRLSDQLAARLTPGLGNDTATSDVRMDKDAVHQQLAKCGLSHIRQKLVPAEIGSVESVVKNGKFDYPFFLKPLRGVGSKGAMRIGSHNELVAYFDTARISTLRDDLIVFCEGEPLDHLLIGEFIDGEEYFVDSFSIKGKLHISSIQRYNKHHIDGFPIYRYYELVREPHLIESISNYLAKCFEALGYRNGFAHTELFVNKNGPVLIELNPRVGGIRGSTNDNARLGELATQPKILSDALRGMPAQNIPVPGESPMYSRALTLFNFRDKPLPDFREVLKGYSTIQSVDQASRVGSTRGVPPKSLSDLVSIVICTSRNPLEIEQQSGQILAQDLAGW